MPCRSILLRSIRAGALLSGVVALLSFAQTTANLKSLPADALMQPKELADLLSKSNRPRPTLIYVGYHSLFVGAHITGAIFAGPDSNPEGIEQLKAVVRNIPRSHAIVVYCGCCPIDKCPNVRPAYRTLKDLGFEHVSVVEIPTNLHTDWVAKGYPTTRGAGY